MPASSTHCERVQSRGVRRRTALIVVLVPACAGFLAYRPSSQGDLRQTVDECRVLPGGDILADKRQPTSSPEVAGGQGPHGHAEAGKGLSSFDSRHLLRRGTGLAAVGPNMRLPTKPRQFTDEHAHLPSNFESCMQVAITPLKKPTADDLQNRIIGRTEEMGNDDEVRPRGGEAISSYLA